MKFYTLAGLAVSAALATAESVGDDQHVRAWLSSLQAEKNAEESDGTQPKSLADGWANSMVQSVNGYGCWCYFENDHGLGRGQPQNEVDAQCKILHDGYSCILMDAEEEGENCVPWEVDYTEPTGLGWWSKTGDDEGMKMALQKECAKKNKRGKDSWCAQRSCMVEGYFSINLFGLLTNGIKYEKDLLHSRNKFDPKSDCPVKTNPDQAEKMCCGDYPIRFPYKHLSGKRECCGQHTFNAEFLQCCPGDEVKLTCF
jgi:hypothetical protein